MLQTIRDRATGWIAYIIIGLLVIPFALWGVNEYVTDGAQLDVAQVGDNPVSIQDFQRAYQQQRLRLQNMLGNSYDPAQIDEQALKQDVLSQLVDQAVLEQTASQEGLRVGDRQLNGAITTNSAFQRDGAFDPELYEQMLRFQGFSKPGYEERLRLSLSVSQLRDGIINSALVTQPDLEDIISLIGQQRALNYLVIPMENYRRQVVVNDSEVTAYFEANQRDFMSPERVRLRYLELKIDQIMTDIEVDEQDLRQAYQEQLGRFTKEELRSASHILVTVPNAADQAAVDQARARTEELHRKISDGEETFQEVMQTAESGDLDDVTGGDLGAIEKGVLDPAFDRALFALNEVGDISEPVRTSFGFHLIRLDAVEKGQVKPFDDVRDELARELKRRRAESRFYDMAETLANLSYENPDNLEAAAQSLGLDIQESEWLTRDGGEGVGQYAKLIAAAFSEDVLKRGLNSEPIEIEPDHVMVVRVAEHKESSPRTLDEARDDIIVELTHQRAEVALKEAAAAIVKRAASGESLTELAEEFGLEVTSLGLVGRDNPTVPEPLLAEAFRVTAPVDGQVSAGQVELPDGDWAVFVIDELEPGKLTDLPEAQRAALAQRLASQQGLEQFQSLLDSLRGKTTVVTYPDRL